VDDLTKEHWKLAHYLRDYYLKFGIAPMIRKFCKETGFTLKKVHELFPSDPAMGACKVTGLSKPPVAFCVSGEPRTPRTYAHEGKKMTVSQNNN